MTLCRTCEDAAAIQRLFLLLATEHPRSKKLDHGASPQEDVTF